MNCCNKPPKGGTTNLGLYLKMVLIIFATILFVAFLFG
jgi:hypothetical protein